MHKCDSDEDDNDGYTDTYTQKEEYIIKQTKSKKMHAHYTQISIEYTEQPHTHTQFLYS